MDTYKNGVFFKIINGSSRLSVQITPLPIIQLYVHMYNDIMHAGCVAL